MTTLSPEKEAEDRLRAGLDAWAKYSGSIGFPGAADVRIADIRSVLSAKEAAEKEVERLQGLVTASEQERYRVGGELLGKVEAAEAKLAALVGIGQELLTERRARGYGILEGSPWHRLHDALSALPPPVPTEEGGELKPLSAQDQRLFALAERNASEPLYVPQDVAGLVEREALIKLIREELTDRLIDTNSLIGQGRPDVLRAGCKAVGYSDPEDAASKFAGFLADRILALRPSPISHEDSPLELAAADNNRELVEVPREPTEAMVDAARGLCMYFNGMGGQRWTLGQHADSGGYGEGYAHLLTPEERSASHFPKAHQAHLIWRAMVDAHETGEQFAENAKCSDISERPQPADNNHKALVEALEWIARDGSCPNGDVHLQERARQALAAAQPPQQAASAAATKEASGQSRQEGKQP